VISISSALGRRERSVWVLGATLKSLTFGFKTLTFGYGVINKTEQPLLEDAVVKAAICRREVSAIPQFCLLVDQALHLDVVPPSVLVTSLEAVVELFGSPDLGQE